MGVSATGQGNTVARIRYAIATAVVFVTFAFYFYGPPLTMKMRQAAIDRCNELTGETYRTYRLEWLTVSYESLHRPHWLCWDTRDPLKEPYNLGWWVDL